MAFKIGKILGFLAFPSTLLLAALILGLGLLLLAPARLRRVRTLGATLLVLAVATHAVIGLTEAWRLVYRPLEQRFPRLADDAPTPAGIVLIGGMIDGATRPATGQDKMGMGIEALDLTIRLARRWPEVPVVLSGTGSIEDAENDFSEAATMARVLIAAGIPSDRLVLERRSRTTWENAVFSHRMVEPRPGARWLLVTPAWHMPRSIGAFRAAGWDGIVAAPSIGEADRVANINEPPGDRLRLVDVAVREWTGLVAYRLLGRSSALYPAP